MSDNNDIALGILGILAIIFFPFGLIWSLNTLLSTGVEYSFWTWPCISHIVLLAPLCHGTEFSKVAKVA